MPQPTPRPTVAPAARALLTATALALGAGTLFGSAADAGGAGHLLISEVATGGASANDEFIELHNPTPSDLPVAGLEVVYVSASGATVTQRATWGASASPIPAGGYLLLANEAGIHALGADTTYAGGIAAGGGTVVLRHLGSGVPLDAVAWGTAAGAWLEGRPAPAPPAGASIERVTRPEDGQLADTDDNAADFVERAPPTPRSRGSAAASAQPILSPEPTATGTPASTVSATPTPSASGSPVVMSIAGARAATNGAVVTVDGTALTGSTFHDGGGYVADGTGGIAVIVDGAGFAAGVRVVVTGTIEDRFAQRTVRASAAGVVVLPPAHVAARTDVATGAVGEALEGRLARISGTVRGVPSTLASGLAFEIDDGSGGVRVLVAASSGIDTAAWVAGATVEVVGVVGQRDSSGSGASGYRLMPRTPDDVGSVTPPAQATSTPSGTATPTPSVGAAPPTVSPIASARDAAPGTAVTVRGVVTMPAGIVDATTAVIQDETAGILVRVDGTAPLRVGEVVEVHGVRSTRSGMETIRATDRPTVIGTAGDPVPEPVDGSAAWEDLEARLVVIGGTLVASARRASSGTVSFDIADDHGVIRVVMPAALGADDAELVADAVVEVVAVVGQETTGAEPAAGYRLWPRTAAEVRVVRAASAGDVAGGGAATASAARGRASAGVGGEEVVPESLEAIGTAGLAGLRIGATLVAGDWPELGISGLLWDGERLVAIAAESRGALASLAGRRPPTAIAARGVRVIGTELTSGVPLVALGSEPGDIEQAQRSPAPPTSSLPGRGDPARWVSLVGRVTGDAPRHSLRVGDSVLALEIACDGTAAPAGTVSVTGIGVAAARVIVPCGGIRAAPMLLRPGGDPVDGKGSPDVEPGTAVVPAAPSGNARTFAAAFLGLAAAVAGGSAAYARRRVLVPAHAGDGDAAEPELATPDPPRLTLVRLRRDGS